MGLWLAAGQANAGQTSGNGHVSPSPTDTGMNSTLQAADINGDGTPDAWSVGAGKTATANLFSQLSTTTAPATLTKVTDTLAP